MTKASPGKYFTTTTQPFPTHSGFRVKFVEESNVVIGARSSNLARHLQYPLKLISHVHQFGMFQDMHQTFVSESDRLSKAIPDHFHRRKIRQRAIGRNLFESVGAEKDMIRRKAVVWIGKKIKDHQYCGPFKPFNTFNPFTPFKLLTE